MFFIVMKTWRHLKKKTRKFFLYSLMEMIAEISSFFGSFF